MGSVNMSFAKQRHWYPETFQCPLLLWQMWILSNNATVTLSTLSSHSIHFFQVKVQLVWMHHVIHLQKVFRPGLLLTQDSMSVCFCMLPCSALLFARIQLQVCSPHLLPCWLHLPFHCTYYMRCELRHKTPSLLCTCQKMFRTIDKCCKLNKF